MEYRLFLAIFYLVGFLLLTLVGRKYFKKMGSEKYILFKRVIALALVVMFIAVAIYNNL